MSVSHFHCGTAEACSIVSSFINDKPRFATHATAPCCVLVFDTNNGTTFMDQYFVSSTADNYENGLYSWTKATIEKRTQENCELVKHFRIENPVFDNIYDARRILENDVLPRVNPHSKLKRRVINLMGEALEKQIGQDTHLKNAARKIFDRLEVLVNQNGLSQTWLQAYRRQHIFFRIKHSDNDKVRRAEAKLGSSDGKRIATRFYETVRKFFIWHLRNSGSEHPDLERIHYKKDFDIDIRVPNP